MVCRVLLIAIVALRSSRSCGTTGAGAVAHRPRMQVDLGHPEAVLDVPEVVTVDGRATLSGERPVVADLLSGSPDV